jgi:hypothetical protein
VGVLVLHPADHRRQLVKRTEGSWPIGDRQAGIVAGDQGAGDDQKERGPSENYGEAVVRRIVTNKTRSRGQN